MTGTGGVGKTRLAVHAAANLLTDYPDGAWLCELAAVADPRSMLQVVGAALGLATATGGLQADDIAEFIGSRHLLMVLDNCEHLLDAAADLVEGLLARCPFVRVLATSREALDVPGEQVIRLRSLPLPETDATLEELAQVDATRLFVERATAVGSQLRFEPSDAQPIVEICRRLDGIPLAIELAAARVVALSPSEIADLLDERFRLLTGGRRASVERHHTLRATIDWSYSLLGDTEPLVFDRLGVFPATFDAAAAVAVAGEEIETWDVIDALSSLVAKSMLVADRTPSGSTRYQMLETLRHYAREQLNSGGIADACRRRHAQHYADFAQQAWAGIRVAGEEELWWSQTATDIDNLRAAVLWALDSRVDEDAMLALQIIGALSAGSFEEWSEVWSWAEQAVECVERAGPELRSVVLAVASCSAFVRADYLTAHRLALDALRDDIPADSPSPELPHLALMLSSRPDQIRGILADGLVALEAVDAHPCCFARFHSTAAGCAAQTGDLQFATTEASETLRIGRQLGRRSYISLGLYLVALTTWRTAPDDALAALDESTVQSQLITTMGGRSLALAAQIRAIKGDAEGGVSALRQAITETHRTRERTGVATAFDRGIQVLASTGNDELAAVLGGIVTEGVFANTHAIPAHELPDRQRALERVEAGLGAERYATAIARGAGMSYDEALDSTIRALDGILAGETL